MTYRNPYNFKERIIVGAIIALLFAIGYGVKYLIAHL